MLLGNILGTCMLVTVFVLMHFCELWRTGFEENESFAGDRKTFVKPVCHCMSWNIWRKDQVVVVAVSAHYASGK